MTLDDVTAIALARHPQIRQARSAGGRGPGRAPCKPAFTRTRLWARLLRSWPAIRRSTTATSIQDLVTMGKIRLDTGAAERAAQQAEWMLVRARFDVLTNLAPAILHGAGGPAARSRCWIAWSRSPGRPKTIGERLLQAEIGPRGDVLLLQIELARRPRPSCATPRRWPETTKQQLAAATGVIDLPIAAGQRRPAAAAARLRTDRRAASGSSPATRRAQRRGGDRPQRRWCYAGR